MDNPETHTTLSTTHRTKTIKTNKIQKTKEMSNTDPNKKRRVNPGIAKGKHFLIVVLLI